MKRAILFLVALIYSTATWAGVETGREAFDRGELQKAVTLLLPLASGGDAEAQYWLGRSYDAMDKPGQAFEWFEKAAKQEHSDAQRLLGIYYEEGKGVAKDDLAAACWYRAAAIGGNVKAERNLGMYYDKGIGVALDARLAAYWYRRAAEQGNAKAQRNLAHLYFYGAGVTEDRAKAAELLAKAGDAGISRAKAELGQLYYWGKGVKQDFARAMALFIDAAATGNTTAQYFLGRIYARGEGVAKDNVEAYYWFSLASISQGRRVDGRRAKQWLSLLAGELDQGQIAAANDRINDWRAMGSIAPASGGQ